MIRLFYVDDNRGSDRFVNEYFDDFETALARITTLSGGTIMGAKIVKHAYHRYVRGLDGVAYNIFSEDITLEQIEELKSVAPQVPRPLRDGKCYKCDKPVPEENERCIHCGQIVRKD